MTSNAEQAIDAYLGALRRFGTVLEFGVDGLDRLGLPVSNASLLAGGRLTHHGNGYGTTEGAARVGGLGELGERVLGAAGVGRLRGDAVRGSRRDLVAGLGEDGVVDPRLLALPAGSDWAEDRPAEWLELTDVRTGAPVRVPTELVASDGVEARGLADPLLPSVTNGLGAGLDRDHALAHGLGEVLQRHANGLRFRALDRLSPAIDPATLPGSIAVLVDRLRAAGVEPVLKHAITEYGVCSTYVMGRDDRPPSPIAVTACGEAADPDPEAALAKALLEFVHSRARKVFCFGDRQRALAVAPDAYREHLSPVVGDERSAAQMRRWAGLTGSQLAEIVAPVTRHSVSYADLAPSGLPPAGTAPTDQLAYLLARLEGHDVLAATTEVDGVVVAKVVVTGLEVETLSHGRIGEYGVRSSLERDLDLVRVGPVASPRHQARVHLTDEAEERLGGPAWFSYEVAGEIVGGQYPQYREPGRHSVVV